MRRLALLLALTLSLPAVAAERSRYIVQTRIPARTARVQMLQDGNEAAAHEVRRFENINAFAADLTDDEVKALRASNDVRTIERTEPRYAAASFMPQAAAPLLKAATAASAISPDYQVVPYGIDMIHAREAWAATRGRNVNIAFIDTGIDAKHPDLQGVVAGTYNTFTSATDAADDNRHGTHVAGIAAAADNAIGVVGVAPDARLWCVKVLDRYAAGDDEHIVAGVDWVISKKHEVGGNWIMSLSLAGVVPTTAEEQIFKKAVAEGFLIVAAAGNRSGDYVDYPAGYPGVMAIGAIDSSGVLAPFSNHGTLSVVAPGVQVLSTIPVGNLFIGKVVPSGGDALTAWGLRGSAEGEVSGTYVYCGLGHPEEIPPEVAGNIALFRRGEVPFNQKVKNALAKGARAIVIFNDALMSDNMYMWTLILQKCDASGANCTDDPADLAYPWPLVVGINLADGQKLLSAAKNTMIDAVYQHQLYMMLDGTSMSTPHVSGTAALVWSLAPQLSAAEVRHAIEATARDLGDPGYDGIYGYGLVDAFAAARFVSPQSFPPRRRPGQH